MTHLESWRVSFLHARRPVVNATGSEQAAERVMGARTEPVAGDEDEAEPGDQGDEDDPVRHVPIVSPLSSGDGAE